MPTVHHSLRLGCGLTVLAEELPGVRSVSFQFLIPAGAVTDPEGREGLAGVLEGLCYRGAGERDSRALSDALDSLGIQRSGAAELEYASYGGSLLADDLPEALALYRDILRRPSLPVEHFPAERDLALQRLARLDDNPADTVLLALRRTYYTNQYGRTALGTREGLCALRHEEVVDDHSHRYRPEGVIFAAAGRIDWGQLIATLEGLFGDWSGAPPPLPWPESVPGPTYRHIDQDSKQEQIGIIYQAPALASQDYYAARLGVEVLSGGMGSRLFTEVREKRGLCYSVRASMTSLPGRGAIVAYAGTTPERCQETLDVLVHELQRLEEGVTDAELSRAKTGVLSALVMQGEATRARATAQARDFALLGRVRTMDEIRAGIEGVTREAVEEAARRYPARGFTVVTLGPRPLEVCA